SGAGLAGVTSGIASLRNGAKTDYRPCNRTESISIPIAISIIKEEVFVITRQILTYGKVIKFSHTRVAPATC
ncbi:MAG: hypothetical protein ACOZBW_09805, partial [Thermodesulfobacteriota bacterium]